MGRGTTSTSLLTLLTIAIADEFIIETLRFWESYFVALYRSLVNESVGRVVVQCV